jgi:hypothetical protein
MPAATPPFPNDPAAIFASATSLWRACHLREADDPTLNLAAAYQGMDEFMRVVMRVAESFEAWACRHVVFAHLDATWPYLLIDRFGAACLNAIQPAAFASFSSDTCLRVAFHLRLPLRADGSLPLPVDVRATLSSPQQSKINNQQSSLDPAATHSAPDSGFTEFRIQSVRDELASDQTIPFTEDHDPFDPALGPPYFALYGRTGDDDLWEHIGDRNSYPEARRLAMMLAPGLDLPSEPVCFRPLP